MADFDPDYEQITKLMVERVGGYASPKTQAKELMAMTGLEADVAEAFFKAADSNISGEVMNVGSGHTYSVNYLAKLLGDKVLHIPKRPGEPDCTFADISKIKRLLHWRPRISFEEGVRKVLENIEYWRDAPLWDKDSIEKATRSWFRYLS